MTPTANAPGRRRNPRGQGQILRDELVDAAARLLAESEQPESLTLRQVAREVGVAPASIYSHFPDLGALLDHVLALRYTELSALLSEAEQEAAPLARLVRYTETFIGWGIDHPGEYRTLFGGRMPVGATSAAHHAGLELLDAMTAALAAATGTEDDAGTTDNDRQRAGLLFWTSMHGLVSAHTEHPNVPWPPLTELMTQLIALHTRRPVPEIARQMIASRGHPHPEERDR